MGTMARWADARDAAQLITIKGVVQGVGFRPFVYRLAREMNIKGTISNTSEGVIIHAEGDAGLLQRFYAVLQQRMPRLAVIKSINVEADEYKSFSDFSIIPSISSGQGYTMVPPDMAVCDECIQEMFDKGNRRYHYPFINCTNCGPRFSIIKSTPYDRPNTTMDSFKMCATCLKEYESPDNRRFHAQPTACAACGPALWFIDGQNRYTGDEECIKKCAEALKNGRIAAVKGIGGFHLMVDARNDDAVRRLRANKHRDLKPFALMMSDVDMVKRFCYMDTVEEQMLTSMRRPIMILKKKKQCFEAAAPMVDTLGVMLPYAPIHYLLFEYIDFPLVATSANLSGQPIIKDNRAALNDLKGIADVFLMHNRDIHIAVDDSVAVVVDGRPSLIRRARGYVPEPLPLPFEVSGVLACGGQQKVTVCLADGGYGFLSQHLGDLDDYAAYQVYIAAIEHFQRLFRITPRIIACDMHPGYRSSIYAKSLEANTVSVQHHHAHIAACMAENGLKGRAIGVCYDGTGYGTDGRVWGGEFIIADYRGFERAAHLAYAAMHGGDAAVKEPYRMALGYIHGLGEYAGYGVAASVSPVPEQKTKAIWGMLERDFNVVFTSSMGRLFDAIASITGIRHINLYDAQAAIELENCLEAGVEDAYVFGIDCSVWPMSIDWRPVVKAVLDDRQKGVSAGTISARFHNAVVDMTLKVCDIIRQKMGLNVVVLSGGVFQNRYLSSAIRRGLEAVGFNVYIHSLVPCNDGGLSLGQAVIAAASK